MSLALWAAGAMLVVLGIVFAVTYLQAGAVRRPLASVGRGGLLAVLVAAGIFLVGASLAAGLDTSVLAPPMLLVGLLLLLLAGLSGLQASLPVAGGRSGPAEADGQGREASTDEPDHRG